MASRVLTAGVVLASALLGCAGESPGCSPGNLLDRDTPLRSYGVVREQRMVDGRAPAPGTLLDAFVTAYFISPNASVTWDLGRVVPVGAIQIVTNNRADGLVSRSVDGVHFSPAPLESERGRPGQLVTRHMRDRDAQLRYLRIEMQPHQRGRAVAEVLAFCSAPGQFPVSLEVSERRKQRVARILSRSEVVYGVKAGLAFALVALLFFRRHTVARHPRPVALLLLVVGTASLLRFGDLAGDGAPIHDWDAMHYYLGAKYFPELRHTELYRCIAKHERESGRGMMVDRRDVRNLDDYLLYSGDWTATPAGACRAGFAPARWRAFGEDVDRFRRLFDVSHFHAALADHGYNATPVHTAWLTPLTNHVPNTRTGLVALAALDLVAIAAATAALWWAFGPMAAGLGLLVLGLGAPWSLLWTGGSIGRFAWLGLLCGGIALLNKNRFVTGTALITLSGLLRLFPFVFVGSILLKIVVDAVRERRLRDDGKRMLLGIAIAFVLAAVVVARDPEALGEFIENASLHASILPRTRIGLGVLASLGSAGSALEAFRGGDRSFYVVAGSLFWASGLLLASAFLLRQLWRRSQPAWMAVCLATPLLFASSPLAGYDYAWLLVLAPLAVASQPRVAMLLIALSGLAITALMMESGPQHAVASGIIGALLVAVLWHAQRVNAVKRPTRLPRKAL